MNNQIFKNSKWILLLSFILIFSTISVSGNREIGGYVDQAESRFVRNVWNFIKNFKTSKNIGSHSWKYYQYYWAEPYEFTTSHKNYVDAMDLAYVAGHGNYHFIETNQSLGLGVDLRSVPQYGDTGDDLEFMIIESCYTVSSAPEKSNWWSDYNAMFGGLHQLVGFHTLSHSDNGIPNNYAGKLKNNGGVWQAWFDAVNEERFWIFNPSYYDPQYGSNYPYPGLASVIIGDGCANDRLGSYASDPAPGTSGMYTYWQY
ncbi:MAG: hypothetical protein CL526_07355 [Aequorivita sp.]|nr:hypothetical protein [Aequorivita sp.]|tara:strand:+ start:34948 stop:35721 length:774 start_codon:yes stop_codon:yes gene_type:complete